MKAKSGTGSYLKREIRTRPQLAEEEKMKKKRLTFLFVSLLALCMFLINSAFAAEPIVTWKVFSPFFVGSWENKTAQTWTDDIFKISGGRMKIEFSAPVAGETFPDLFKATQDGMIDAAYTWPGLLIGKYPAGALFAGTPAFFDLMGYYTWMHAYGGKELFQETYGDALKVFPANLFLAKVGAWTNKKIETMDDFKGLKYRTSDRAWHRTGDLIWGKILTEKGASPIKMPYGTQAAGSLRSGTLDAAEGNTPWGDMSIRFHKVAKFCYFPGIQDFGGFLELIVNNQKWDALPPDLKEIVKVACDATMARSLTKWALDDAKVVKILRDEGQVNITKFSKEVQQEILDRFVAHYDAVQDPMFQKVWKSQKEFIKIYVPYMKLQQVDAEVKLK